MKNKLLLILLCGCFTILNFSCNKNFSPGPTISACKWTFQSDVSVNNVNLKLPSNLRSSMASFFPSDGKIPTLTFALQSGNTNQSNKGEIQIGLKSSGKNCTGEFSETLKAGSSRIGGQSLNLKLPNGVNFLGSATMSIRSDDYRVSSFQNEYVLWIGTGNDPEFNGINGDILGAKKYYDPRSGKVSTIQYYSGGEKKYK